MWAGTPELTQGHGAPSSQGIAHVHVPQMLGEFLFEPYLILAVCRGLEWPNDVNLRRLRNFPLVAALREAKRAIITWWGIPR
jgi:hypothetical protein